MMQMGAQPPARAVYQRALKPSPCVYFVVPAVESKQFQQLRLLRHTLDQPDFIGGVWVEAGLVDEQGNRVADSLDGVTAVRLQKSGWHDGVYTATFKKIKLLITSQQKDGSQFCLRFALKYASLDLGPLGEMAVLSNPVAVFSRAKYLEESSSSYSTVTRKYAHNPVGLQLKVMEMIHACKELGGSEEVLHQCIAAAFSDGFFSGTFPESLLGRSSTQPSRTPATTSLSGGPPLTTLFENPANNLAAPMQPRPLLPSPSSAFHVVGRPTTVQRTPLLPSLNSIFPSLAFSPQPPPSPASLSSSPPDLVGGPESMRGLLSLLEKVASDSDSDNDSDSDYRKHPCHRPPATATELKRWQTNAGARATRQTTATESTL